jgi:hypothetical protein
MARARRFQRDFGRFREIPTGEEGFGWIPGHGRGLNPRVPSLNGRRRGKSIPEAVLHVKLPPLNSAKGP